MLPRVHTPLKQASTGKYSKLGKTAKLDDSDADSHIATMQVNKKL